MVHIEHRHFHIPGFVYLYVFDDDHQNCQVDHHFDLYIYKDTNCEFVDFFKYQYPICYNLRFPFDPIESSSD